MSDPTNHDPAQHPRPDFPAAADLPPAGIWLLGHGLVIDEVGSTRVMAHLELGPEHHTP